MTDKIPQLLPDLDFNPAKRNAKRFGADRVDSALYAVGRRLKLYNPLPYERGIDGNHWIEKNIIQPKTLALAVPWGYWKLTDGLSFYDTSAPLAITLKQLGMSVMVFYHFFRRNLSGVSQADFFDSKHKTFFPLLGGKKIAVVDYETDEGVDNESAQIEFIALCNRFHALGYKVVLYMNNADWNAFGMGAWVENYVDAYIIAHWKANNSPTIPSSIDPAKVLAQQEGVWNAQAHVLPVPGAVPQLDCNLLLWTFTQLKAFTGQGVIIPPPPITTDPPLPALARVVYPIGLKFRHRPTTTEANNYATLSFDEVLTVYAIKEYSSAERWALARRQDDSAGWFAMKHPTLKDTNGVGAVWVEKNVSRETQGEK